MLQNDVGEIVRTNYDSLFNTAYGAQPGPEPQQFEMRCSITRAILSVTPNVCLRII